MNLRRNAAALREKTAELTKQFPSGYCHITDTTYRTTTEVNLETAARMLLERTHQLAEPADVEAMHLTGQQFIARNIERTLQNQLESARLNRHS